MKKIELVCKTCDKRIEISEELYEFLQKHLIIHNANNVAPKHYALVTTDEAILEEFK